MIITYIAALALLVGVLFWLAEMFRPTKKYDQQDAQRDNQHGPGAG